MLYCEDCKLLCSGDECSCCGNKNKLRAPKGNDPVYLITKDAIFAAGIEDILKKNDIPCLMQGELGEGIISRIGYTKETYRFFVPFGAYNKSKELLSNFFEGEDDQ